MRTTEQKRKEKITDILRLQKEIAEKTEELNRLLGFSVASRDAHDEPPYDELPGGNYSEEVLKIFKENPDKKLGSIAVTKLLNKKLTLKLERGKVYSAIHYLKVKNLIVKSDTAGQFILTKQKPPQDAEV